MNFFEHQDLARRNTFLLVLLFGLAVVTIILAVYGLIWLALSETVIVNGVSSTRFSIPALPLLALVTVGTLAVIGGGSMTKMAQLGQGGHGIAQQLGGRRVDVATDDAAELRLLNVVAEMALAAGTPIPTVYVLDQEQGINAFAAGKTPEDAVIGVTRGCLEHLSRDELQGVIGHEFSHILNGDMGLNFQLIGIIHGLLTIYILGRLMLRTGYVPGCNRDRKEGNGILMLGLGLMAIGLIGVLFGRLIKSGISRQREFLADASAVQFTRNPNAIADALRKIGQVSVGSRMASPMAETASHLFFGESSLGLASLGGWFATHPPLKERIRRLGAIPLETPIAAASLTGHAFAVETGAVMGFQGRAPSPSLASGIIEATETSPTAPSAMTFLTALGSLSPQRLERVRSLLDQLDPTVKVAIHDATEAQAMVLALLLRTTKETRSQQLVRLKQTHGPSYVQRVGQYYKPLKELDQRESLLLVEAVVPALHTLAADEKKAFLALVQDLAQPGDRLLLTNYSLNLVLRKRLQPQPNPGASAITTMDSLWPDAQAILSLLARVGHTQSNDALYAFKLGLSQLPGANKQDSPNRLPPLQPSRLTRSLDRLGQAVPKLKQAIVDACAHTALADNDITPAEMSLLRAIVITLDCPAPPFLVG
jgi:Zn-dependent protease with chaperone function